MSWASHLEIWKAKVGRSVMYCRSSDSHQGWGQQTQFLLCVTWVSDALGLGKGGSDLGESRLMLFPWRLEARELPIVRRSLQRQPEPTSADETLQQASVVTLSSAESRDGTGPVTGAGRGKDGRRRPLLT